LEKQISQAIRASGLSLKELGRASGVDAGQLSRFLRGHRSMHLPAASKVCKALGLELVQREKAPKPKGSLKPERTSRS
jgi:transcriptional regulator with XRE-family HTH domain